MLIPAQRHGDGLRPGTWRQLYGVSHECDYPPQANQVRQIVTSIFQDGDYTSSEIHAIVPRGSGKKRASTT